MSHFKAWTIHVTTGMKIGSASKHHNVDDEVYFVVAGSDKESAASAFTGYLGPQVAASFQTNNQVHAFEDLMDPHNESIGDVRNDKLVELLEETQKNLGSIQIDCALAVFARGLDSDMISIRATVSEMDKRRIVFLGDDIEVDTLSIAIEEKF